MARTQDEMPVLKPRPIRIDDLRLIEAKTDSARFAVDCGKGAYIRSLARDLGLHLGSCAYVSALRRTKSANFH